MRIVSFHTLIAVLSLAAIMTPRFSSQHNRSSGRHSGVEREHFTELEDGDQEMLYGGEMRPLSHKQMQHFLRREYEDSGRGVDCCPSQEEMVEPVGGQNVNGVYVELYKDGDIRQRFYELSCREDVVGKPCRFLDRRLQNQSRCVQKYSFSYAIIQQHGPADPQLRHHHSPYQLSNLDYIKVRSGCSCEVMPKAKKKRNQSSKGKRGKSKRLEDDEK